MSASGQPQVCSAWVHAVLPHQSLKVLLLMWTDNIDLSMQIEMLELFSGRARVTEACREAGKSCIAYDSMYDPSGAAMNFLSDGGFALEAQYRVCCYTTRMHASITGLALCIAGI